MQKASQSRFVKHISCDVCGSSDGNALYSDNHTYCMVCNTYKPSEEEHEGAYDERTVMRDAVAPRKATMVDVKGQFKSIPDRGISQATCEKYGVTSDGDNQYYPYTDGDGVRVAVKQRNVPSKSFSISGDFKGAALFGQHLFHAGGKAITITEGELDALAAFQMQGSLYPTVSIRNGAQAALKDCKAQYEWLNSFDSVVICFDADEPGKKAAAGAKRAAREGIPGNAAVRA